MAVTDAEIACTHCGETFPVNDEHLTRARMAWSNQKGHFVRVVLSGRQWADYLKKGSVD